MHPAISYELATARIADLRHQAQRDALARAVTGLSWSAPRSHRNQIPVSLRGWPSRRHRACETRGHPAASSRGAAAAYSGSSAREWQTTTPAPPSSAARQSQGVRMTRHSPRRAPVRPAVALDRRRGATMTTTTHSPPGDPADPDAGCMSCLTMIWAA